MRLLISGFAVGILLLLPACTGGPSDEPFIECSFASYAFEKQYLVTITNEMLKKTAKWGEKEQNPPLSAGEALKASNKMKDSLIKDSTEYKWRLRSLDLTPAGGRWWYWRANYEATSQGGVRSRALHELRLAVLMDGTVPEPKVNDQR